MQRIDQKHSIIDYALHASHIPLGHAGCAHNSLDPFLRMHEGGTRLYLYSELFIVGMAIDIIFNILQFHIYLKTATLCAYPFLHSMRSTLSLHEIPLSLGVSSETKTRLHMCMCTSVNVALYAY